MRPELEAFIKSLTHYLDEEHGYDVKLTKVEENRVELEMLDDDGEEIFVGNYADSGLTITWIGRVGFLVADGASTTQSSADLVLVNGVVFQALGRHVAGWVVGYA